MTNSSSSSSSPNAIPPGRRPGHQKLNLTRHPRYRGVRKRESEKWVSEMRQPGKRTRIWLGTYPAPEMAARAHDAAALFLRGPDSVQSLPTAPYSCPEDVRRAAAQMASQEGSDESDPPTEFLDEDAIFNMPGILVDLAAGLIIAPPGFYTSGFDWDSAEWMPQLCLW